MEARSEIVITKNSDISIAGLAQNSNKSILVLEDDTNLKTILTRVIKSIDDDIHVEWATELREAKEKLDTLSSLNLSSPELIIADIFLPNLDMGTSLLSHALKTFPSVPFAFMSSLPIERYFKLFENEVHSPPFLPKPFSVNQCRETIESILKLQK